ncbi:hypothetical protein I316_06663 [Kwoniella heveanensis BCC8398]|uniref:DUF7918 domain-containing protein n=1 Tax=Kwoniella heveanensis BCC8398 TaxID=1296120 RepID=A0A1B9GL00_9TREE|nr:hypothetical protein I316_06663 [Kwoniella heveanensis BCC8398]
MLSGGANVGFEAYVQGTRDKKRLNEYQIRHRPAVDGQPPMIECFLETIHDTFKIVIRKTAELRIRSDWRCTCLVDGIDLTFAVWHEYEAVHQWDHFYESKAKGHKKVVRSALRFAPLPTTDDLEAITLTGEALKRAGTIELTLERGSWELERNGLYEYDKLPKQKVANEKLKNGYNTVGPSDARRQS